MQKILLLEDDITLGSGIRLALQSPTVQITLCRTLAQARDALGKTNFDLLILDDMGSRFYSMGYQAVLSADALRRDAGEENVAPMLYLFDTPNAEAEAAAERYLSNLAASDASPLMYESKATHRSHFWEFQMTFVLLGGLLCAIIGIVGVLNFFNAMMTSILSRRRADCWNRAIGSTAITTQFFPCC